MTKQQYSQLWEAYNKAQSEEKLKFMELLEGLCDTIPEQPYRFGRPTLPLPDMIFASVLKIYTTFSGRRASSDMQIAAEKHHMENAPHYNTVFHYLKKPELTPILKRLIELSSLPLKAIETDFATDSTGFSTSRFSRWFDIKYGKEVMERFWVKVHIMCGVKTNIITAVEITEPYRNDITQFERLLEATKQNFSISEVSADKAYLSRKNLNLVSDIGATAYIPFKKNSLHNQKGSKIWNKLWSYFMFNREEFMLHYHKRSNVETTFHMIKSKFGFAIRSRNETTQVNELLCKVLCHNLCVLIQEMNELGIETN